MTPQADRRSCLQALSSSVLLAAWPAAGVWAQTEPATQPPGRLQWVTGLVHVVGPSGQREQAQTGTALSAGHTVETAAGASAHILLTDGGYVAVRSDSAFTLVSYSATAKLEDSAALTLVRGALRVVTGWLGKTSPRSFSLRTSTATVGIRGTDFEVVDDATDTHVRVHSGEVLLGNAQGFAEVGPGDMATLNHSNGNITRHGVNARSAQQVFDRARVDADAAEERVNLHAKNINQHMESSLRESGVLRADQSMDTFMENRKEAVERLRQRVDAPRKEGVLESMQDARDRALANRPGAAARAKEAAAQSQQGGAGGGLRSGGDSRAGGGGRSGGGGGRR